MTSLKLTRLVWISVGLTVATVLVYAPVRHFDFVNYDDRIYVTDNPRIVGGLTVEGLVWVFTNAHSATWHPLTGLSHMLDCQLFGLRAGGHHASSVLLHVLNALLLFAVLRRMTARVWPSAWVAGAFALHPMHVESVAWIAERKDVLSTLFFMLTLGSYVRYVERPTWWRYLVVGGLFALGLMAKPMLVTVPFVLLLLDYWPLQRWPGRVATASSLLVEKLPLMALAAVMSVVTVVTQQRAGALATLGFASVSQRLANAVVSYATYLAKLFWPVHLAVFYPYELPLPVWKVGAAVITLCGLSAGCVWLVRRYPYLIVGWLWFLGTLVPVIGLVQVSDQAMADRFTYVPYIGLFLMLAWGFSEIFAGSRWVLIVSGGLTLGAWGAVARAQVSYWRDTIHLFEHAVAVTHDNSAAYAGLACALAEGDRMQDAIRYYDELLRLKPGAERTLAASQAGACVKFHIGLGLAAKGQPAAAAAYYEEAVGLNPQYTEAQYNWGLALAEQGKFDEAIVHYKAAIHLRPDYTKAHNNLGWALAQQGKFEAAVAEYQVALQFEPDLAAAHNNLGVALEMLGRMDAAVAEYGKVVRLVPDDPRTHYNFAAALAAQGHLNEALEQYRAALRLRPEFPEAQQALAALDGAHKNP